MIFSAFKAPPSAEVNLTDPAEINQKYRYWQGRMFWGTFIGYAVFYFCRKNISVALPAIGEDLQLSNTQLGLIGTSLYFSYMIGKFLNGILADRSNVRMFMAFGLLASALTNILFGFFFSLFPLIILWGMNGWFQSMGWPPCAKTLTHWYSLKRRGTIWGLWSTSHQVGGAIILIAGGFLVQHFGWRWTFWLPGLFGILTAFFLFFRLRDRPTELGLPPIEIHGGEEPESAREQLLKKESLRKLLFEHVLVNKFIWLLALQNVFLYIVRYAAFDWSVKFLVEEKGSQVAGAGAKVAVFEAVSILGTILAGYLADRWFRYHRSRITFFYMLFLSVAVYLFWLVPGDSNFWQLVVLGSIGFLVYGPQMLIGGPCTVDFASKKAAATATGFVGLFGYLGAMISGVGSGWMIDHYGWEGAFLFWTGCALAGAFISILLWRATPKTT